MDKATRSEFISSIFRPITKEAEPDIHEAYGADFIETRVNPFLKRCAEAIAHMPKARECFHMAFSTLTSPASGVIVVADFSNGWRYFIRENDFDNPVRHRWQFLELNLVDEQQESENKVEAFKAECEALKREWLTDKQVEQMADERPPSWAM